MKKKYSLHITISTLFIVISMALAIILSWQSFNKTSDIMLDSAHDLYGRISQELILDFKTRYGPLAGGLRQVRLSPVIKAKTFAERIASLPNFKAVLESGEAVSFTGVAYPDGDYLGFSDIKNDYVREKYHVPTGASYMVLYVKKSKAKFDSGFEAGKEYRIFYDDALHEVTRSAGELTKFDARLRPWYLQATDAPSVTKPYLLYGSSVVGLSVMSKTEVPGVVVVFGVLLNSLNQTIADYQLTENSEVVLINADGETFAYKDVNKFILSNKAGENKPYLANLNALGSDVLSYIGATIEVKEQTLDFEYDNQRWIGSAQVIAKPGGVDLYALMVSPVAELLVDAIETRWRLIQTAFFILLVFIPIIWFVSRKISAPLQVLAEEAKAISRFDFNETDSSSSFIKEVDELDSAMSMMKSTISKFIKLIDSLAGEKDLDALLKSITEETMKISQSDAALIYLMDETDDLLKADFLCDKNGEKIHVDGLDEMTLQDVDDLIGVGRSNDNARLMLDKNSENKLTTLLAVLNEECLHCILLPLKNRSNEMIGLLCLMNHRLNSQGNSQADNGKNLAADNQKNIEFVQALSGFAAVTLESRQLFNMQEALLHSFIELIAGAIDAKSPYTSGHCQRVPEITFMLAEAACESTTELYNSFNLDDDEWKELKVACWLHDCGKVTTPEYVVDKATKLETIYDRIHEVRTRFEVLKRDAEIDCWQKIAEGGDKKSLQEELKQQCSEIDDDFSFLAECNVGGEFMADEKIERLQKIAQRTWMRTIDDNLGLSWEELNRKTNQNESLPVEEKVLADKVEHLIERHEVDKMPKDNQWGFKVDTPEYKYNRGELYNLSVKRGTLSEEERYMINGHMIQTVIMLNQLPYPKNLSNVPLIAGSHHETMDGKGYPKRLVMTEQPLTARMMVIADIFEALTASDRPYKKAKTLSESIRILSFMRNDKHIDADLFDLFLTSGVYLQYGKQFLSPEQIDEVNVTDYLS